jgi:predicted alpha/beta-hydrolase family hydrolase
MEPVQITTVPIGTEGGAAQAELDGDGAAPRFLLVLTHGAGGSAAAPDLLAARDAALPLGGLVARVTQPYRVRGARAPGSPVRQDAAWAEVVAALRERAPGVPLVQGGRSNGARVACRTAAAVGARAVIALAFPLRPPRRPVSTSRAMTSGAAISGAATSRVAELHAAREGGARVLVVNGDRDPFGIPGAQDADRVVVVPGETHALKGHRAVIVAAVAEWLPTVL